MIPIKLQIKNFLSYGPITQTIDFAHYPLICLSGKNGHGKSALLEAITWALWGQARKVGNTVKPDLGLLRLGQTNMMVVLDFILNGVQYRARREFTMAHGKATAHLEFGIIKQDGTIVSLTDKTIKETQEKLEQTLHLDYESFTNSAFLRQGQANEFSKKSAKERKEVLTTILGVSRYEQLKRKALEHAKNASNELNALSSYQEKLRQEIDQTATIQETITATTAALEQLEKQEVAQHANLATCTKERALLIEQEKKYELLQFQLKQLHEQEQEKQYELRNTFTFWRQIHKKLLTLPDKKQLVAAQQQLLKEIHLHQEKLQKQLVLKEEYLKNQELLHILERKLHNSHAALTQEQQLNTERAINEHTSYSTAAAELKKQYAATEIEQQKISNELQLLNTQLAGKEQHQRILAATEAQFEKRKNHYQTWITQGNSLSAERAQLKQKQELSHDAESPSCPLCEQNLSSSRRKFLLARLLKDEQTITHRIDRISGLVKKLKPLLIEQHEQVTALRKQQETYATLVVKQEELTKQAYKLSTEQTQRAVEQTALAHKLHEAELRAAQLKKELEVLTANRSSILEKNNEYVALAKKLADLVHQGKTLQYDAKQHDLHQQELKIVEGQISEHEKVAEQASGQQERAQTIQKICEHLRQAKNKKRSLTGEIDALGGLRDAQKNIHDREQIIQRMLDDLKTEKERLLEQIGSLKNQQEKRLQFEAECKKQEKKITELARRIDDYQMIAKATGKDGIQALLIEEAIPEIEEEANALLGKLTNNQAQLFIESLRDLKNGGTQETLDIKISDAMGIRSYEMFSGGEAFRIDFSLRIAISKLLARRAGTSLQTLIIDEGFGSQDEEGLSHLMDAIHKIQSDFAKVIIVSHLNSMKDQFPVHFVVEKLPNGSCVQVMEQG